MAVELLAQCFPCQDSISLGLCWFLCNVGTVSVVLQSVSSLPLLGSQHHCAPCTSSCLWLFPLLNPIQLHKTACGRQAWQAAMAGLEKSEDYKPKAKLAIGGPPI